MEDRGNRNLNLNRNRNLNLSPVRLLLMEGQIRTMMIFPFN